MTADDGTTQRVAAGSDPAATRLLDMARALLTNSALAAKPWTGLTVAATIGWWDPAVVRKTPAWYYTAEPIVDIVDHCWEAVRFEPREEVHAALISLAQAMAERDETAPWTHCLIQIDRASEDLTTKFSYDEESPWQPDFSNLDGWVESLRPSSD